MRGGGGSVGGGERGAGVVIGCATGDREGPHEPRAAPHRLREGPHKPRAAPHKPRAGLHGPREAGHKPCPPSPFLPLTLPLPS
jgi:hypothetical protein